MTPFFDDSSDRRFDPIFSKGVSVATAEKVRAHYRLWEQQCRLLGIPTLPLNMNALARLIEVHGERMSYRSIAQIVSSIRRVSITLGFPWPENDDAVRWALVSARSNVGIRASRPLIESDMNDLADLLTSKEDFFSVRDWAIFTLGTGIGGDARDLATLLRKDIIISEREISAPTLSNTPGYLPTAVAKRERRRCPVVATNLWLSMFPSDSSTLFYDFDSEGRVHALTPKSINAIVRARMIEIHREGRFYSCASLKAYRFFVRDIGLDARRDASS